MRQVYPISLGRIASYSEVALNGLFMLVAPNFMAINYGASATMLKPSVVGASNYPAPSANSLNRDMV